MRLSFWLCVAALACALTSPASSQQAADRVALVIGNSNYPDASTPLTSTSRDARAVAAELRRLGFGVDLKENVTRQEMQAAIDAFMGKIGSGHRRAVLLQRLRHSGRAIMLRKAACAGGWDRRRSVRMALFRMPEACYMPGPGAGVAQR